MVRSRRCSEFAHKQRARGCVSIRTWGLGVLLCGFERTRVEESTFMLSPGTAFATCPVVPSRGRSASEFTEPTLLTLARDDGIVSVVLTLIAYTTGFVERSFCGTALTELPGWFVHATPVAVVIALMRRRGRKTMEASTCCVSSLLVQSV